MHPAVMEIDLNNFKYNVKSLKSKLSNNTKIMPVVKANAYGTYINERLDILNEFDILAIAIADEGEKIRKLGYEKEIFILNQPDISELDKIIEYNLTVGVSNLEFVKAIGNTNSNLKIHIEMDTGMGRTGLQLDDLNDFIDYVEKYPNIKIDGVYTHFSSADTDYEYTKKQIELFNQAVKIVKSRVNDLKYIHSSASNGIINFPESHFNLVRPGMILYGYSSGDNILDKIDLKPVCKLKSKITFLKNVDVGTSIGYSRKFITEKPSKVATVLIGYADGLRRNLSNNGEVVVNGQIAKIIGNVCMDSIMIDVTDIENVKLGDDVLIWDNEKITLDDVAQRCDTINYEIMSTISNRVLREFV